MFVKFEYMIVNLNNIVQFYYHDISQEYEKPYCIRFATVDDAWVTFDFETKDERDNAFKLIISYWKCNERYLEI